MGGGAGAPERRGELLSARTLLPSYLVLSRDTTLPYFQLLVLAQAECHNCCVSHSCRHQSTRGTAHYGYFRRKKMTCTQLMHCTYTKVCRCGIAHHVGKRWTTAFCL